MQVLFYRYGSVEPSSFSSTATVVPKRPPPIAQDHTLVTALSLNRTCPLSVTQDRCYEIHNTDPVRIPQIM